MDDILQVRDASELSIIIVEHEMGVIARITDRCVVLNFGLKIAEGPTGRCPPNVRCKKPISGWHEERAAGDRGRLAPPMTRPTCWKTYRSRSAGAITCLLGSNGSGKTTLIRSILGLTPPRSGSIVFDGADITALPTHHIAAGIACIPEGRKVFPKLTVEDNLRLGAYQEPSDAVEKRLEASITSSLAWPSGVFSSRAPCRAASRRWCQSGAG